VRRIAPRSNGGSAATVVDVAREAGVSLATVSRVLNGNAAVSADMRERVHSAVRELGFRPNPMAQGLRKGQTKTVALLVGDIAQRHFAELTMRVQAALEDNGIDLLLFNLGHSETRLTDFLTRAVSMRLRGVIIALSDDVPRSTAPLFAALRNAGITLVSIGQNLTRHRIPSIVHEERTAAQRSTQYLLDKGHTRVAYIGRIDGSAVGTERFRGYKAALTAAGLFREELVWDQTFRYAAGRDAVSRALDRGLRFTGVQAASDEIATGAIAALHDRGIRVPDDVAVIGFGDIEMGAYLRPALTTLSSHPDLAAQHASALFKAHAGPAADASLTLLERSLVERDSA
jgi:DNA-binding LacI/PurR family transcriptional regulator